MKNLNFVKKDIVKRLLSDSREDIQPVVDLVVKENVAPDFVLNRKEILFEISQSLNSKDQLIALQGFRGTGKTEFTYVIGHFLEDNALNFYYKCSPITTLDDLIMSIYFFIGKSKVIKHIKQRASKNVKNQSIDEKLIGYLRNIKSPLLITIDSFEYLINENNEIIDPELEQFVKFIISLPSVKLVLSGKKIPLSILEYDEDKTFDLRIVGLEEEQAYEFLKTHGVDTSSHTMYQIFEATRGYPLNLRWFASVVNLLGISPFDLLKEYAMKNESIESFLVRKAYHTTSNEQKKMLWLLATIRQPLKMSTLEALRIVEDTVFCIEDLHNSLFVTINTDNVYLKGFIRELIYNTIPIHEKVKIHKYLRELYESQIPLKPSERVIEISRKSMHAEKYFHYVRSGKNQKEFKALGQALSTNNFYSQSEMVKNHGNINYMPANMVDTTTWTTIKKAESGDTKIESFNKGSEGVNFEIDKDIDFALSEEEKALLQHGNEPETSELAPQKHSSSQLLSSKVFEDEKPQASSVIYEGFINEGRDFESKKQFLKAYKIYEKALEKAKTLGNKEKIALFLNKKGMALKNMGKINEAIARFEKAFGIYEELKEASKASFTMLNIAKTYNESYKHDIALKYFKKILNGDINASPAPLVIETFLGMGDIYEYRGEYNTALKYYTDALNKSMNFSDKKAASKACFQIALIQDDLGNTEKAIEFYRKNIELSDNPDINDFIASSYANIAAIYLESRKREQSIVYYQKALEMDRKSNNPEGEFKSNTALGNIMIEVNDPQMAIKYFIDGLKSAKQGDDAYNVAAAYLQMGDLYTKQGQYEKGIKSYFMAKKSISNTISTDSKDKIERRLRQVMDKIGENKFKEILGGFKKKNG